LPLHGQATCQKAFFHLHMTEPFKIFDVPQQLPGPSAQRQWTGLVLESGRRLEKYHLAYSTYGHMNADKSNVVWVFHALTANSQAADWWDGLVGPGKLFDPAKYFIVCVNTPGGCYGSIGPLDVDPTTGAPFYHHFPYFSTRDLVRAYQPLRHFLGIDSIQIGIGGSMGGQQLLEWAIEEPALFRAIIPIATNAQHSSWGVAFNTAQRMAIEADGTWHERRPDAGLNGMKAARAMALLSYRHYDTYRITQPHNDNQQKTSSTGEANRSAASYQRYQGQKLADRFNAFSYYTLSKTMDSHHLGRGRQSVAEALKRITAACLVIGITSDLLFPLAEQQFLAQHIGGAEFRAIDSLYGHDGFLLEFDQIAAIISTFLAPQQPNNVAMAPPGPLFAPPGAVALG
jgi:homoserine O-acetyltransferase/O-succinyltransferase